jgi:acetate---CoA ligase (ADP-forming)
VPPPRGASGMALALLSLAMTYQQDAVLRDGTSVVIRSVRAEDRGRLRELFARMSPRSVRHRFFAARRELAGADLDWLERGGPHDVALAAITQRGGREHLLGLGRYVVLPDVTPHVAEIAFEVGDADQGRGIGTLLLEHLARIARAAGLVAFRAEVEADNARMLDVFEQSGFGVHAALDQDVFRVEFPIAETERFVRVAAERERRAAARSLRAIFAPSSVAVIGASRTPGTIGRAILDNLVRDGFRGPVYPIHPTAPEIGGRRAYRSVTSVGAPVELAIVAVPAAAVEGVLRECADAGVQGIVVISAGFAEMSIAGQDAEVALRELVRTAGMRMVGPNCMGVLSTSPDVRLNATFSPRFPPAGNVSMVSQSGALGLAMVDRAVHLGLGIADFISIGNKADVSVNDVLAYWHTDPRTQVIALYLESFGNPRAFARLAPEVARAKPIVAVKSGRSAAGTRAAASHSAALASLDVGIDALFAQTGVTRVDTIEQLFDVVSLLSSQPAPEGPRVGVVTNAGGPGILLADACEAHGLVLPKLAEATLDALRGFLPVQAGLANPIDMIAAATPAQFEATLGIVGHDPNVDAVVAIYVPPLVTRPEEIAAAIARGAAAIPPTKPVATVFMATSGVPAQLASGPRGAIPTYTYPENAAMALAAAVRHARWRRRPIGQRLHLPASSEQAVRARVRAWLEAHPEEGWLPFEEVAQLLAAVGIELAPHRQVPADAIAAADAARELGFPIVLKAIAPDLVHKSDVGGVALGLGDREAVIAAAERMRASLPLSGLLVQRQIPRGVEALVGVTLDPSLGPLVVAGIGGTAVELYRDVAFRVTPVTDVDAAEMLDQLRGRALLDGFRGSPPADRAALSDVIQRVAALVELVPELVELDLNPVIVREPGSGAVAVDARVRMRTVPRAAATARVKNVAC